MVQLQEEEEEKNSESYMRRKKYGYFEMKEEEFSLYLNVHSNYLLLDIFIADLEVMQPFYWN